MRTSKLAALAEQPDWTPPATLPSNWKRLQDVKFVDNGKFSPAFAFRRADGLTVLVSVEIHECGRRWVHASASKKNQLPSWQDLKIVKDLFFGPERLVVQILAPKAEWVNFHETTLHLWHCIDEPQIVPMAAIGS